MLIYCIGIFFDWSDFIPKNVGKVFEDCFIKSFPNNCLVKRLNDNAASWSGGTNTRFSSKNECDFLIYEDITRTFYGLELKSSQGSLTFWRKDFDVTGKKNTYNIKKCQICGLSKWSKHNGVFGFVFNFRSTKNQTYFVYIDEFLKYTDLLEKKSINIKDVLQMNPIEIHSEIVRVNYKYDIETFLNKTTYKEKL